MDSISGQTNDEPIKLHQEGEFTKINFEDLPLNEQEKLREFIEMTGDENEPELYIADFRMEIEDLAAVPLDILGSMYRDAIFNEEYEDVGELGMEIKKRNYSIEITEKSVTLTRND